MIGSNAFHSLARRAALAARGRSADRGARLASALVALFVVLSTPAWAWNGAAFSGEELTVARATQSFYAALNRGDAQTADEYLLPGGDSFPRDGGKLSLEAPTANGSLKDLADKFAAGLHFDMSINELQVHVYGRGAAVATFYTMGSTHMKDRLLSQGTYRATYVWVRIAGKWKVAHFHLSPLKP